MGDSTRRGFLAMAGMGAAAVGVGAAAPGAASAAPAGDAGAAVGQGAAGPLVAYVRDVRRNEISVMVGEHEVVLRDRDLVNRLVHASRG
ncbi:twin-arginine translocation signal domain-containing protein [Kribbella sp. NPDC004536]|uniref:twin-arginine translocation signal domain-containing protein n=1 Tax=Kribbella sp. NPDC004536 TaxID=3364106 RepID=UPI00369E40BA